MTSDAIAYSAGVPELSQADFTRGVRGEKVTPGRTPNIELVVKGISSISRAAVRRVHNQTPDAALAYYADKVARFRLMAGRPAATAESYRQSLLQYIAWDGDGRAADLDVRGSVAFGPEDRVRALAHVVLDPGDSGREARILLWDELPLDQGAAEMIALPIVECVNAEYGAAKTANVEVWQLAQGQRYSVSPAAAEARRGDVESFLADL